MSPLRERVKGTTPPLESARRTSCRVHLNVLEQRAGRWYLIPLVENRGRDGDFDGFLSCLHTLIDLHLIKNEYGVEESFKYNLYV